MEKLKWKSLNKLLTIFLLTTLILPLVAPTTFVKAEEASGDYLPDEEWLLQERTGQEELKGIEISEEEASLLLEPVETYAEIAHVASDRNYEVYGNDYCYSRMNSTEQAFYDRLDAVCMQFMSTTIDAAYASNFECYYVSGISYSGLTRDRASDLIFLYMYQNPQYYFLDSSFLYSSDTIWVLCYDEFSDGDTRADVTTEFFENIDGWIAQIEEEPTDYEKEKLAHDIVCNQVTYDFGYFDQSAYSSVIQGVSVCAGYAKMFSILMNGVGIETVGITGSNHAWNRVKLYGKWYNVDTTWDDPDSVSRPISYTYFNKSDASIRSGHIQYEHYDGLAPICGEDYVIGASMDSIIVNKVSLNKTAVDLNVESLKTESLTANISPADATDKTVYWSSSDSNVATVSQSGVVTAVSPGKTIITVITTDGSKKATCTVNVYQKLATPAAPVVVKKDATSITLQTVEGCQYSKDGKNWQNSSVFTGLKPNTEYTFYLRKAGSGYYLASDASQGTKEKTNRVNATVTTNGLYVAEQTREHVLVGMTTNVSGSAEVEYRWIACNENDEIWFEVSGWTKNSEWLDWKPKSSGNYVLVGQARIVGNDDEIVESSVGIVHHPQIKGKCQMPYDGVGGGYLIGFESYDNPNQTYQYEMLILDCTLLAQEQPAWIYTTGKCRVPETSFWTIWQPQYGYYWTLFRIYDSKGNLVDEECYPFVNAY